MQYSSFSVYGINILEPLYSGGKNPDGKTVAFTYSVVFLFRLQRLQVTVGKFHGTSMVPLVVWQYKKTTESF